jgi:hypothetical protein
MSKYLPVYVGRTEISHNKEATERTALARGKIDRGWWIAAQPACKLIKISRKVGLESCRARHQ